MNFKALKFGGGVERVPLPLKNGYHNLKNLILKSFIVVFFAFVGVFGVLNQKSKMLYEIKQTSYFSMQLQLINNHISKLKNDIFRDKFYLYFDNDIINKEIKKIDMLFNIALSGKDFKKNQHKDIFFALKNEKKRFEKLKSSIYEFLRYNAPIKNSSMYLSRILEKSFDTFNMNNKKDRDTILLFSKSEDSIFFNINTSNNAFMKNILNYNKKLYQLSKNIKDSKKRELIEVFRANLGVFTKSFPILQKDLNTILTLPIENNIKKILKRHTQKSLKEEEKIDKIFNFILILYLFSITVILFFIFHTEKENLKLKKISKKLYLSTITDKLTGLSNRTCYKKDKKTFKNPSLILININDFKDINNLYGTDFGDKVLQILSKKIDSLSKGIKSAKIYRVGADDFGILSEFQGKNKLIKKVLQILHEINNTIFEIDNHSIDISISIGVSYNQPKLLECADIALKKVKLSYTTMYQIYKDDFNTAKNLEKNLEILSRLKKALLEHRVIPYFQPIVNLNSGKIVKYEALVRLIKKDGEVLSPFYFLDIAKKAKLISKITEIILLASLKKIREESVYISVNIPNSNMTDIKIRDKIINILELNKDITNHLTFELLESEEMMSYKQISEFITLVKKYNCKISIDDFGSGYSNFEELLRLNIDTLKIDGTLIKNIDKDKTSQIITKTILEFTKKTDIELIAEFVHSKEVAQKLQEIGIKFAQGYYFGKPAPNI